MIMILTMKVNPTKNKVMVTTALMMMMIWKMMNQKIRVTKVLRNNQ